MRWEEEHPGPLPCLVLEVCFLNKYCISVSWRAVRDLFSKYCIRGLGLYSWRPMWRYSGTSVAVVCKHYITVERVSVLPADVGFRSVCRRGQISAGALLISSVSTARFAVCLLTQSVREGIVPETKHRGGQLKLCFIIIYWKQKWHCLNL